VRKLVQLFGEWSDSCYYQGFFQLSVKKLKKSLSIPVIWFVLGFNFKNLERSLDMIWNSSEA
jgi:hypothetical protein